MVAKKQSSVSKKEAAIRIDEDKKIERAARLKSVANIAGGHGSGFMNFIREQGVVGLAVGLAIGLAATDTVQKMVQGFINPLVALIVGSQEGLQAATWTLRIGERSAVFAWGAFVSSAITLLATALVIYWLVHVAKLDKLDKKKV